jgi:hypothetical protein
MTTAVGPEPVEVISLDDLVARHDVDVDDVGLVWIDVQGLEGSVLQGGTRRTGAGVPLVFEYWPESLRQTGSLEPLRRIIGERSTSIYDLRVPGAGTMAASQLAELGARHPGSRDTDVLAA